MRKKSSKNVVEINGRLYDAQTGLPVTKKPAKDPTKSGVIDGFVKKKPATAKKSTSSRTPKSAKSVHKKTKRTATLHRAATNKPKKTSASNKVAVKLKKKALATPHKRVARAKSTPKSPEIAKFKSEATAKSLAQQAAAAPQQPANAQRSSEQLAQQSLEKATAHEPAQKVRKPISKRLQDSFMRRPRAISISASVVALLLVAGYVTYLNIPNLALRVAAREAGFEAAMPGYSPSGYKFAGPVNYEQGRITLKFDSKTSDDSFEIVQRETNWDSQSLLDNFVVDATDLYQTYQERGLTIYVYEGSEATWVNGGVWYAIEGDSRLNAEQLIRIASSL